MKNSKKKVGQEIVTAMVEGYGPNFPGLKKLFSIQPSEEYLIGLNSFIPGMGRYRKSIIFLEDVTSQKVVSLTRFRVIIEYLIALSELMANYDGKYKAKKIIDRLKPEDIEEIRQIGTTIEEILWAEEMEKYSQHDTAAAIDLVKLLIARRLPHLAPFIEAVHYGNTSEDVMGNVFGLIGNELVYKRFIPAILDLCETIILHAEYHEKLSVLILPALTHQQAAEYSTWKKKVANGSYAINNTIRELLGKNGKFKVFSGHLSGGSGGMLAHFAAYPDIDWWKFAKKFVEGGLNLHYESMTNQSVSYAREAHIFKTLTIILSQIVKLTDDFIKMASCPAQFFIKEKKAGVKASSTFPNKCNAWKMEGAIIMIKKTSHLLEFLANELQNYPHEGDMKRSYLFRDIGTDFMHAFIGFKRIIEEMKVYHPNNAKISAFLNEYPGMVGSTMQHILKRERISGDAYRIIQGISINPNGSYANMEQFKARLEEEMELLNLALPLRQELRNLLVPYSLVMPAHNKAIKELGYIKRSFGSYRKKSEKISGVSN